MHFTKIKLNLSVCVPKPLWDVKEPEVEETDTVNAQTSVRIHLDQPLLIISKLMNSVSMLQAFP